MRRLLSLLGISTTLALAVPAAAPAASITYIGPDHNVYLSSPDGSVKKQVTTDGSAELPYATPSQADDGMIVAVGEGTEGGDSMRFAYFLKPDGTLIETQPLPVPPGIVRIPALTGGHIEPGGGLYLYDWAQSSFGGGADYATSLIGRTQSLDACGLRCKYGYVSPRWIGTTNLSLVISSSLDEVAVQPNSDADPVFWFNLGEADEIASVDESDNRLVLEAVDPAVGGIIDVLIDKPPTKLVMAGYSGTPGSALPAIDCDLPGFAQDPAYPRLSPDGTQITWSTTEGVFVSPTPTETGGGTCTLRPKLIAPGGTRPDWGPADVPAPANGDDDGPGADDGPSAACRRARQRFAKARKQLKAAKRNGTRKQVTTAKRRLAKARKARRLAC